MSDTPYNTGNPVGENGSSDPRDLIDNARVFDRLLDAEAGESVDDRLGVPRKSWATIEADQTALLAAVTDEADRAEAARDSSFANAKGAATIADARALVADLDTFIVYADGAETFDAYRRESSSTQTFLGSYPAANRVELAAQQLGLPLESGYGGGTLGVDSPNESTLEGGIFAPRELQPTAGLLSEVRFWLRNAGTYTILAYQQTSPTTWEVDAAWPGVSPVTGLVQLRAGKEFIPAGYEIEEGGFVAIATGSARIGYSAAAGAEWVNIVGATTVGSSGTRNVNANNFEISIAYDFVGVLETVDRRLTGLESEESVIRSATSAVNKSLLLAPKGNQLPDGWLDAGVEVLGLNVIAPSGAFAARNTLSGTVGFALLPSSAQMFQDLSGTPADGNNDPVRKALDAGPVGVSIESPADISRPVLVKEGGTTLLRFDGEDDRFTYTANAINPTSLTFVCSVARRAAGYFPQVIGDVSTANGVFCGFSTGGVPRFSVGTSVGVLSATEAVPVGRRVTLTFTYDGAQQQIYQNGALVASAALTGTIPFGIQPLICYSGANAVISPLDLYGAVLVGRAVSESERKTLESVVSADGAVVGADQLKKEIDQAVRLLRQDFGAYFGLLSPIGTTAYSLGDSTVAAFAGGTAVMVLVDSTRTKVDISEPGHTINQQLAAWNALTVDPDEVSWVVVQIGLNDLNPGEAAPPAITRLQSLVDTIRNDIGDRLLLVSKMIPARSRLIDLFGEVNGQIAQEKWEAINDAIAGVGPTPITNVDGRITAHVPLLDDGAGNLRAEFDTGDGIHPNTLGRQIVADAWEAAISASGVIV